MNFHETKVSVKREIDIRQGEITGNSGRLTQSGNGSKKGKINEALLDL